MKDIWALFGSKERVWMERSKKRKIIENSSFHCLDALSVRKENIFWEGPTLKNFQSSDAKKAW